MPAWARKFAAGAAAVAVPGVAAKAAVLSDSKGSLDNGNNNNNGCLLAMPGLMPPPWTGKDGDKSKEKKEEKKKKKKSGFMNHKPLKPCKFQIEEEGEQQTQRQGRQ
jgi:hypothetical protein